jgi:hypothetical protein
MKLKNILLASAAVIVSATTLSANTLTTSFVTNNGFAGNMFDVTIGAADLTFESLDVNIDSGTAQLEFYSRVGSYVGNQNSAAGWTLISSASITSTGGDAATAFDITDTVFSANTTYGLYVTVADYDVSFVEMNYINGTEGALAASNSDLSLFTGVGKGDPNFTGSTFNGRTWSGSINYSAGGISAVPLPATLPMLAVALFGAGALRRRGSKK